MSDDIDRFILQYSVDLKDSVARLERLHGQMDKVGKGSGDLKTKFTSELKGALDGLTQSFGGLEGGLGRVIGRLGAVGGAAGVAAAGVAAAVALAAKGIRDINAMQDLSYKTGIGPMSMENIQRNVAKYSNGRVSRDMAKGGMEQWRDFWKDAYVNPSGKSALAMGRMGVNVRKMGPQAAMAAAAEWMHAHQGADALAIGNQIGWNPNLTNAMAAGGKAITTMSMSPEDINRHAKAEQAAQSVNKFLGDLNETLSEWKFEAADKVINFFRSVSNTVDTMSKEKEKRAVQAQIDPTDATLAALGVDPAQMSSLGVDAKKISKNKDPAKEAKEAEVAKKEQDQKEQAAKVQTEAARKQIEAEDQSAMNNAETDAEWKQITEMFSSAVSKFSGAVDPKQALAAWAGEVGKANGLPGSTNDIRNAGDPEKASRGLRNNNPANIEYGPFAKAHGATGTDGRFAIFPSMEAGAAAHESLLQSNYLGKGLKTPRQIVGKFAPANENDQAKYLNYLKSKGFDPDKPVTDVHQFAAAQQAFESGYNSGHGIGESRAKIQRREVQQQLASSLGVPLEQVQRGGISKGDAAFASQQAQAGISNHIFQLKKDLLNPMLTPLQRGKIQYEIRDQQRGLNLMQQYSGGIAADQKQGGRVLTEGQLPTINITNVINGTQDPKAVAEEINRQIRKMITDTVVNHATGIKG
ncbi:hypothetical protein [Burkholderia ubonensis]|uniref:hypothetical protein n=1 Tax=Burkholderia ubonensis TaxID=101571 RepID=UPI00075864D2|nr:hypothetical protein [Burkholderia ubonensis]KWC67477.1 hypothetical protein WL53_06075 [Burkholderia ubonensis]